LFLHPQRDRLAPHLDHVWVDFKVFGVTPLTLNIRALQVPLLRRYAIEPAE